MIRIAVVATMFGSIVDHMIKAVEEKAQKYGANIVDVYRVPGLLETPLVVKKVLEKDYVDGVIVLGAIYKETSLEEFLFNQVVNKLLDLSLEYGKPIGFGISGPGIYWSNRLVEEGGKEITELALSAVKKVVDILRSIDNRYRDSEKHSLDIATH
ncbi:MAG: 6,7-dimethyl-8-ribityllumazine synthase [Ignisphaera sp.]